MCLVELGSMVGDVVIIWNVFLEYVFDYGIGGCDYELWCFVVG